MDFGYIPESVIPAKLQLESVEMGDMDTANGIKALDEYLVQSGKFTAEERALIISNVLKNNPELLKNRESAVAVGVAEVNVKVIEETTETYIPKHIKMIENLQDADLGYSEEQMNALLSVGEELLLEGFDEKFVAGVLGNIVAEGAFGSFESSAYTSNPEEEPEYLGIVDANCNYRESFSGKNIQEVGLDETVALYEEAQNIGGGFGLGCVQWTFSRTGDLLECYKEVCTSNYPTIEECYKAEVLLIKKELRGDYSYIYNNWEKENETSNIETCVREASNTVFCDYEKPGTDDMSERADNAWEIYQTMLGDE